MNEATTHPSKSGLAPLLRFFISNLMIHNLSSLDLAIPEGSRFNEEHDSTSKPVERSFCWRKNLQTPLRGLSGSQQGSLDRIPNEDRDWDRTFMSMGHVHGLMKIIPHPGMILLKS